MHHYCFGLELVYQASLITNPDLRIGKLRTSIAAFQYVLNYGIPGFPLQAEGLLHVGLAHLAMGQNIEAVDYLTESLTVDPRYVAGYVVLAGYFERYGDLEQAAAILRKGLEHVPDSAVLSNRLGELEPSLGSASE